MRVCLLPPSGPPNHHGQVSYRAGGRRRPTASGDGRNPHRRRPTGYGFQTPSTWGSTPLEMLDAAQIVTGEIHPTSIGHPAVARQHRRGKMWGGEETDQMPVPNTSSSKAKLTGRQKWAIAGLICLQVPSSVIFYPLAALFSLTGIGIPLSLIFLGIGTMPYSLAMKRKVAWQSGGELGHSTAGGREPSPTTALGPSGAEL